MVSARARVGWLAVVALAALGGDCGGGSGEGGDPPVTEVESPDARCAALPEPFPPGFAFVPGRDGRVVVASLGTTPSLIPFDVEPVPPEIPAAVPVLGIPLDSDGDGREEGVPGGVARSPILDDVFALGADFGLATASSYEEVLFFSPAAGALRTWRVEVPASVPANDYPFLPAPGTGEDRTGLSTRACVRPPAGARDSRGVLLEDALSGFCDPALPSFRTGFTSGVARAAGRLFVSSSNLGADRGTADTQFLPGTVLVYDLDESVDPPVVSPHPTTPALFTTGFNPTHVTAVSIGGRELVLVTLTGALGIEADDPGTKPVEGAGIAITPGAIDVIDPVTLEIVATVPLGLGAPTFDQLAIDPDARVAVTGSAIDRVLYAVDLAGFESLPASGDPPLVLDAAVIFDADTPFRIPALANGAPPESCPGETFGVAFNDAGDRLYATDFCDGTLAVVEVDLSGDPTTAELRDRFLFLELERVVSPLRDDTLGRPRAPGQVAVRPGRPGVDYDGPDVFFLVGQEGLLCGVRIESD